MDTGKGKLVDVEMPDSMEKQLLVKQAMERKYPEHGGWFRVGEVVYLRGSKFRIKAVKPTQIILKLLPKI